MFCIDVNHQPNDGGVIRTTYTGENIIARLDACGALIVTTMPPTLPDSRHWCHTYPPNTWSFVNEYDTDRASDDPYPGASITQETR